MGFSYTPMESAPAAILQGISAQQVETSQLTEQLNVLVIGVEEVGAAETRLKSIWLILVPPNGGELTFLPIYPQAARSSIEVYAKPHEPLWVDARSVESATIIRLLAEQKTWWHEVVLVDEAGLASMLELLGGVDLYTETLAGVISINAAPNAWEQPQAALASQTALFKDICGQSIAFAQMLDPGAFLLPDSGHFKTSSNHVDLFSILHTISLRTSISGFGCQFPTLE